MYSESIVDKWILRKYTYISISFSKYRIESKIRRRHCIHYRYYIAFQNVTQIQHGIFDYFNKNRCRCVSTLVEVHQVFIQTTQPIQDSQFFKYHSGRYFYVIFCNSLAKVRDRQKFYVSSGQHCCVVHLGVVSSSDFALAILDQEFLFVVRLG